MIFWNKHSDLSLVCALQRQTSQCSRQLSFISSLLVVRRLFSGRMKAQKPYLTSFTFAAVTFKFLRCFKVSPFYSLLYSELEVPLRLIRKCKVTELAPFKKRGRQRGQRGLTEDCVSDFVIVP